MHDRAGTVSRKHMLHTHMSARGTGVVWPVVNCRAQRAVTLWPVVFHVACERAQSTQYVHTGCSCILAVHVDDLLVVPPKVDAFGGTTSRCGWRWMGNGAPDGMLYPIANSRYIKLGSEQADAPSQQLLYRYH